jgi:hypothetical protein
LRINNEIQKTFIDEIAKSDVQKSSKLLNYLEIDDIEIAKYFYTTIKKLPETKANEIFSDYRLREKIKRITISKINPNDKIQNEMIEEFSFIEK